MHVVERQDGQSEITEVRGFLLPVHFQFAIKIMRDTE